ncbi:unnamed protein product [Cunninghamella echinulata]
MLLKLLNLFVFVLPTLVFARRAYIIPANDKNSYLVAGGAGSLVTVGSNPFEWDVKNGILRAYTIQVTGNRQFYISVKKDGAVFVTGGAPDENSQYLITSTGSNQCIVDMLMGGTWTAPSVDTDIKTINVKGYSDSINQRFIVIYLDV